MDVNKTLNYIEKIIRCPECGAVFNVSGNVIKKCHEDLIKEGYQLATDFLTGKKSYKIEVSENCSRCKRN